MNVGGSDHAARRKIVVALVLVLTTGVLVILQSRLTNESEANRGSSETLTGTIGRVVDTLLAQHNIERKWIKTWEVRTPKGNAVRIERRVMVPPDFISVEFNHQLSLLLDELGAKAIATEKLRDQSVTMHIRQGGRVVYSITFAVNPDLERSKVSPSSRKE